MNREEDKKQSPGQDPNSAKFSDAKTDVNKTSHEDEDQHSYQGKLDHVEGNMDNGELGGGIRKEE